MMCPYSAFLTDAFHSALADAFRSALRAPRRAAKPERYAAG
jgi:hypothetical protein